MLLVRFFFLILLFHLASATPLNWTQTTNYPISVGEQSCVVYNSYVYCVGGFGFASSNSSAAVTNLAYYARVTNSGGLSGWIKTTSYPVNVYTQSCVAANNYLYCIGGVNIYGTNGTSAVYYAPILSSGALGNWSATTAYPVQTTGSSCVTYNSVVYCIGGGQSIFGTDSVYYAKIQNSGALSSWSTGSSYPVTPGVEGSGCLAAKSYIYCIGGLAGFALSNQVYYARILPYGNLSTWNSTTAYPSGFGDGGCSLVNASIFCTGIGSLVSTGAPKADGTYIASIGNSGMLSSWKQTIPYPSSLTGFRCVPSGGNVYCIGGIVVLASNSAYYLNASQALSTAYVPTTTAVNLVLNYTIPTTSQYFLHAYPPSIFQVFVILLLIFLLAFLWFLYDHLKRKR